MSMSTVSYGFETTELRGDQRPHMGEDDLGESPPIFFHLDDYFRHPLQHTRSTRIPLYHVNHVVRG